VGKTGVELRWHEPQKFSKLTKEQKLELSEWNKTQPKREGGKKRTSKKSKSNEKWKKARVASVSKAHTELMEAMAVSHSADMAVMNARIAGMIAAIPLAAGVATGRVGATVGFHPGLQGPPPSFIPESIDVMAERARVASVNLKNILKPPSKQAAP
jgi:alpha-galactosidase/6-phospho-beta-glucosidase family protein